MKTLIIFFKTYRLFLFFIFFLGGVQHFVICFHKVNYEMGKAASVMGK